MVASMRCCPFNRTIAPERTTGAPKVSERVEVLLHVCPRVLAGMPDGRHSQQSQQGIVTA